MDTIEKMAEQIHQWLSLGKFFSYKDKEYIKIEEEKNIVTCRIYTNTNRYTITALIDFDDNRSYLGCTATGRKPRAGEDWNRGNDLHDGSFSKDTFDQIIYDILSYELVDIKKSIN